MSTDGFIENPFVSTARGFASRYRDQVLGRFPTETPTESETLHMTDTAEFPMTIPVGARVNPEVEAERVKIYRALRKEAIRRDWCSEYDEFVERVGGIPRDDPRLAPVLRMTVTVEVPLSPDYEPEDVDTTVDLGVKFAAARESLDRALSGIPIALRDKLVVTAVEVL